MNLPPNADNNQNDNDQLLTENDTNLSNKVRLHGFIQEYHVKIIEKLNKASTKRMFWTVNLEFFLSIAMIAYLYITDTCDQFQIYDFFPFVMITVLMVELVLKISLAYSLRKEAEYFHTQNIQKNWQNETKNKLKQEHSKCRFEMRWFWGVLHLESFYLQCLSRKLLQYNRRIIEYEEHQNQLHEQQVTHQSIQVVFSFFKFRQLYINLKMCIFLLLLKSICSDYSLQLIVLVTYTSLLMVLNIWINYHFANTYLFCRSSALSGNDFFILLAEISIKCFHSLIFLYILTHIESVYITFSSIFIGVCSILAVGIVVQINSNFDSPTQGVFEMIFLGYSVNYYVGLKHREYFVKRVAYRYKIDLLKQIVIIIVQLAIILDYYEANLSRFFLKQEVILGITCALGLIRLIMIFFKISYYLKPKQSLIRVKTFSGTPHFIEETISSQTLQTLNLIPHSQRLIQQQQQQQNQQQSNIAMNTSITINDFDNQGQLRHLQKSKESIEQSEIQLRKMVISKLEQSSYKLTFFSESELEEFEYNSELRLILSEFVKYTKSELIFLISNEIKILNQYGHINVVIHRYDKHQLLFIEKYITPHARSILIDSCYSHNTDVQTQLILLYNTINKEFDVNTKILLKPSDMVVQLPIPSNRKIQFIQLVNQVSNSKLISIMKTISFYKHISPNIYQNPQYALYDLLETD